MPACEHFNVGLLPTSRWPAGCSPASTAAVRAPADTRMKQWGTGALTDERFDAVDKLAAFAAERSSTLLDVALGGLAAKPAVTSVIAGATTPEQLRANVADGAWRPADEELGILDEVAPMPG